MEHGSSMGRPALHCKGILLFSVFFWIFDQPHL